MAHAYVCMNCGEFSQIGLQMCYVRSSSTCVSTVQSFMCHLCPQGYMEPFSHHSCVKNSGIDNLAVAVFGNDIDLLYLHW